MPYCRPNSESDWYCYWCNSPTNRLEDQLFAIEVGILFNYKQLKDDLPACLAYRLKSRTPAQALKEALAVNDLPPTNIDLTNEEETSPLNAA